MDFFRAKRYYVTEEAGVAHQVGDYGSVVRDGLRKADERAASCLETGSLPDGTPSTRTSVPSSARFESPSRA